MAHLIIPLLFKKVKTYGFSAKLVKIKLLPCLCIGLYSIQFYY